MRVPGFLFLFSCLPVAAGPVVSLSKQFGDSATTIQSLTTDRAGNVYIVGTTTSSSIPLLNPIQATLGSSNCSWYGPIPYAPCEDVFVAKFDPTGTNLLYSTYLGPTGRNFAASIAVDGAGNAYIAGTLDTPGTIENSVFPGKAFLYKLNSSGSAIVYYHTFDSLTEAAASVAVDSQGNAYLAGNSYDLNFPSTFAFAGAPSVKAIYVSRDSGATWAPLTTALPAISVYSMAFGPGVVYAATSSGLFRSSDAGAAWTLIAASARQVVADPKSSTAYATSGAHLSKSTDGGASWNDITSSIPPTQSPFAQFGALAIDPSNSANLWVTNISMGGAIFRSTDVGAHWQDVHDFPLLFTGGALSTDPDQSGILVDPANSSRVYVCCIQGASAIVRTTDGGAIWSQGGSGPTAGSAGIWPPVFDPHNALTLWASYYYGLERSTDAGQTWNAVVLPSTAPPYGYSSGSLALDPSGVIYLVNDGGVLLRSADAGATWTSAAGPWGPGARILAIDPAHPSTLYVSTAVAFPSTEHAFLAKFDPAGNTLWATTLGGSAIDEAHAVAVDTAGNAYIAGRTTSRDFPVVNALQPVHAAPGVNPSFTGYDAFVSKISADGSKLLYSTYLGGSGADSANAIAVDASGAAYVAGSATGPDFPSANSPEPPPTASQAASFIAKIDPAGQKLIYSILLGDAPSYNTADGAYAVAVDSSGAAWIGGSTSSTALPLVSPIQAGTRGTASAYVAQISPSGSALQFSTYLTLPSGGSEVVALAPLSPTTAWLASTSGTTSIFAHLDLAPQVQPNVPTILAVYNAAGYQPGDVVAPGQIVTVFGSDLADGTGSAASYPLPKTLQGTFVTVGGLAAPMYYAAPDQINFQVPSNVPVGTAQIIVNRGGQPAASRTVGVIATNPGVFMTAGGSGSPIVVHNTDFSLVTPQNPAHPGEYLAVFCTGLGATTPTIPDGTAATGLAPAETPVEFVIDSRLIAPTYAGLAPGFAGVYQVNFQLPADVSSGTAMLSSLGNSVSFPVQ